MLFANEPPATWVQAVAAVATALVGAWLTLRLHQIDRQAKKQRRRNAAEKRRCDGLEVRVEELEAALGDCQRRHKPRPRKPPRKGGSGR